MKKLFFVTTLGVALLASCNRDKIAAPKGEMNAALPAKPHATIPVDENGIILKSVLSKDTVWKIDGVSFVQPGKTLIIQAGTHVISGITKSYVDKPTNEEHHIKGVLVVPKNAQIIAEGTASQPIVFTSDKAPGQRKAGDFGGIILLGNAPINQDPSKTVIEGLPQPINVDITYGGSKPADNSGILKYVRIEFAGYNLNENNEINGLTCGGVGNGTTLENIQVSWGRDDAFEFFGGTVNAKYLVALSNDDDDFDFDFGYSGTIQYALSLKDPNSTFSTSSGKTDSNGLESDNNGKGEKVDPTTRPNLKNFTFIGIQNPVIAKNNLKYGNRWRRATSMNITNSIIAGYDTGASFENITTTQAVFSNNVIHAYSKAFNGTAPGTGNLTGVSNNAGSYLKLVGGNNIFYVTAGSGTTNYNVAHLRPSNGSPAYGNGSTTFKGAFHPSRAPWTAGWTQFSPKTY